MTLPYLTITGPMRIPELTVRLQNLQVQYSPGSIPIPGTTTAPVIIQGVLGEGTLVSWFGVLLVIDQDGCA